MADEPVTPAQSTIKRDEPKPVKASKDELAALATGEVLPSTLPGQTAEGVDAPAPAADPLTGANPGTPPADSGVTPGSLSPSEQIAKDEKAQKHDT